MDIKNRKVNGNAPFFGAALAVKGKDERIYSVFRSQSAVNQTISLFDVNGNTPFYG
ncbi:hypothetical protein [Bacteroides sp. 224]|uniref:hypothetical protein n=1 Tax=Bacteroides sp. 224 TaxID=2302936 RepID=UPI0013D043D7|nr:hypothetical protein [Bacteroides sp. 224]